MSGESSPRATAGTEPLERAFGRGRPATPAAPCAMTIALLTLFLHDTVIVRSYAKRCYPLRPMVTITSGGTGLWLDYHAFAQRFGAPGHHRPCDAGGPVCSPA
jgi:hypothetical protein